MSHTGKLYQYYLKRSLWRNGRLWGAIALCGIWGVGYSGLSASQFKDSFKPILSEAGMTGKEEGVEQEFGGKGTLEKTYQGALLFDEEAIQGGEEQASQAENPKNYQTFARLLRDKRIVNSLLKDTEQLTKPEKGKNKYFNSESPYYTALIEFSSRQKKLERGGMGKKIELVHHLSLGNASGLIMGIILAYSLLDSLFVEARKNGEDATVLVMSPRVERGHLFFGKSLALLSNLAIYTFLGFILPYTIILLAFGPGITSGATYLLLVFGATFAGSVLFFFLPASFYLFASNLGMVGKIIQFLLHHLSTLGFFLNLGAKSVRNSAAEKGGGGGNFFAVIAKIEYYYYDPLFHIAFAVILGGLFLIFCYSYYQQEDLN